MKSQRTAKHLPKNPQLKRQTFQEHLYELRSRILVCITAFIIGSVIGYILRNQILLILVKPLNQTIFYTSPAGGFDFMLKISLFFGFIFSLPLFAYHAIRFIEPALPAKIPGFLSKILIASTLLLLMGMSFAYFVSLPAALYFLNKFTSSEVNALISTTEYFTFVTRYLIGFGLVFQLPLILLAVNVVKKIPIKSLLGFERWVIVISTVIAAILTPTPDILNQLVMAIPLILLYQVSILLIYIVNKKHNS